MADPVKHIGKFGEKPCVVLMRELPQENESCLIVQTSALADREHDELMEAVQSVEAQRAISLADVLQRKHFSDGTPMLNGLHFNKRIQKVPVSHVKLTPLPNQDIALAEVNAEVRKLDGGYTPPMTDEAHLREETKQPTEAENTPASQAEKKVPDVPDSEDPEGVAQGLIMQANLMKSDAESMAKEAESLLEKAYSLAPSLKPKKGPGRPRKENKTSA